MKKEEEEEEIQYKTSEKNYTKNREDSDIPQQCDSRNCLRFIKKFQQKENYVELLS